MLFEDEREFREGHRTTKSFKPIMDAKTQNVLSPKKEMAHSVIAEAHFPADASVTPFVHQPQHNYTLGRP